MQSEGNDRNSDAVALTAVFRVCGFLYLLVVAYLLAAPFADPAGKFSVIGFVTGQTAGGGLSIRDLIENWLLAIPFGILVGMSEAFSDGQRRSAIAAAAGMLIIVILPAEILQHWMPPRHASMIDVLMMLMGAFTGVVAIWCARVPIARLQSTLSRTGATIPLFLALCWVLIHWVPNRFELSAEALQEGISGLANPLEPASGYLAVTATWLAVITLIEPVRMRSLAGVLPVIAWIGLVIAPGRTLSWPVLIGSIAALLIYLGCRSNRSRTIAVAGLVIAGAFVDIWTSSAGSIGFAWSPFAEYVGVRKLEILTRSTNEYAIFMLIPVLFAAEIGSGRAAWLKWTGACAAALLMAAVVRMTIGQDIFATPVLFFICGIALASIHLRQRNDEPLP